MGTGQMMMVAFALMLFGKLVLSGNSMVSQNQDVITESEYVSTATSIGQSMIERVRMRRFDGAYAPGQTPADANVFTPYGQLGRDAGELAGSGRDTLYNDIDDYRGYTEYITTATRGSNVSATKDTFTVSCNVYYVNDAAASYSLPADSVNFRTFTKCIDVSVTNSYMVDPTDPSKLSQPVRLFKLVTYR